MRENADIVAQRDPGLGPSSEQDGVDYFNFIKDQRMISKSPSQLVAQDDVHQLRCYRQRGMISFIIVRTAAILAGLDPLPIRPTNDFPSASLASIVRWYE